MIHSKICHSRDTLVRSQIWTPKQAKAQDNKTEGERENKNEKTLLVILFHSNNCKTHTHFLPQRMYSYKFVAFSNKRSKTIFPVCQMAICGKKTHNIYLLWWCKDNTYLERITMRPCTIFAVLLQALNSFFQSVKNFYKF